MSTPPSSAAPVAGSPGDFLIVHHLVARGTEQQIGAALADEARATGWSPGRAADPVHNRARRRWFERNWPQHYARMTGIAAECGLEVDDDGFDFSSLRLGHLMAPQCSAMWISPHGSADGHARVGRNLDFRTSTASELLGAPPTPGELPVFARPYLIETYPDGGYASLVVAADDFATCYEGINEHGLTVALLSDDESTNDPGTTPRPALLPQAGVNELQLPRYILDTCASAAEAKQALYQTKQYDEYGAVHYLIADPAEAFVWERDTHNAEHAVDAETDGLCVTNYLLHRRDAPSDVPPDVPNDPAASNKYWRARVLYERLADNPISDTKLWDALEAVRFDASIDDCNPGVQVRTLWHAQYHLDRRAVDFEFYLGEHADGRPRRSSRISLRLADTANLASRSSTT